MSSKEKNNAQTGSIELSNKDKLRQWLIELISQFRDEMKKLSAKEREAASRSLEDLSEPCQFLVIWAKDPEFQVIFIIHSNRLEDKLIEIYGPIENHKLIDYIENEILRSPLIQLVGRERAEDFLTHTLRTVQRFYNPLHGFPKPTIDGKTRINAEPGLSYAVGWLVIGSLQDLDVKDVVSNSIKEIVSIAKPAPTAPPTEEKAILEGFGTYIYPPVWIGEMPRPRSFKEKVRGFPLWVYSRERVITDTYKGRPFIVTRDGYIAIGEKEKSKAHEFLNEIMSTLLLRNIPVNAVREIDLGEATFKEKGESFSWSPISSRAWFYLTEPFFSSPISVKKRIVTEESMRKTIKLAELLTSDDKIKTLLLLYLEACTYFMNTEHKQALIMGWIILEDFYVKDLWHSHISKIVSDKNRLNKLMSWTVDQRLEALNISHVLSNEDFALLMKIKDARNEVAHEGRTPQKDVVKECIELVSKVIQKRVGDLLGMVLPKL